MNLNHIHLMVTDVAKACEFFETFFEMKVISRAAKIACLTDDSGMILLLMYAKNPVYPEFFHIGFMLSSRHGVNELHEKLDKGKHVVVPPSEDHHGYTLYAQIPGGPFVEVLAP